jgi:hypothetical protein
MLRWLTGVLSNPVGSAVSALKSLVTTALTALGGVIDTVFGDVTGAWADFVRALQSGVTLAGKLEEAIYGRLDQLIRVWIPRYAMTAWWWVTHPASLAKSLFWHILRELEDNADQAAEYLGAFTLALLVKQTRTVVTVLEHIIAAVL